MASCGRLVIGPARPIHGFPERVTNPLQVDNLPHMPAASVTIFCETQIASVLPLLSRNTANFRLADLAGNEALLLLHRD
jgi:hypothetical protein